MCVGTAYVLSRVCTEAAYVLGRLCVWTPLYAGRLIAGRLCTEPLMYGLLILLSPYGLSALLLSSLCVLGTLCAEPPLMYCAACAEPLMC